VLQHAVKTMPEHIGTWHALAWTELLSGEIDAAANAYESAYELDRNFADSHGGLALIAALRGEAEAADLAIRRALKLDPNCATAHYARSILLADAGKTEDANRTIAGLMAGAPLPADTDIATFARNLRARIDPRA
jgi:Tfp pilus assembly protein PilF